MSAWFGCGTEAAPPSPPLARAGSGGNPAGQGGGHAGDRAGNGGTPATHGGEAGAPSTATGGTCAANAGAGEAGAGGAEAPADAGNGGEPAAAGAAGDDSAGGADGSGGASQGEAGAAVGTAGSAPTQPQSVNGCKYFIDVSEPSAPRTIDWGVTLASNPARCLRVAPGQTVTWLGSFDSHPIQPYGGTQPTPISGDVPSGATEFSVTFREPGVYGYECGLHASMRGAVQVH